MKYIFMDLDGTITNPAEGITKCFEYALQQFGIAVESRKELEQFIGPPLRKSFMDGFGFTAEQAERAVAKYRERFVPVGMFENEVYDGMEQALQSLKKAGKTLVVATSKPEHMAIKILEHFHLDCYFDDICGSCDECNRNEKEDVIRYALEKHGITDLDNVLMVGDRKFDVIGAAKCGLKCMGVLYGFGDKNELEQAGAAYVAETVEDMARIIVSL